MKNWFLVVTVLGVASCATPKVEKIVGMENDYYFNNKVSYLGKTDRAPSSEPVFSWEVVADADQQKSFRVDADGAHKTFDVTVNQVASWDEPVKYIGTCQVPGEIEKEVHYYDYECTSDSSVSNPLWNAYFQAKKAEKAKVLSNAIKGVGEKSAAALVEHGYFHSKPKTWQAFKDELRTASDAGVIKKSVYTQATTQYGSDNLQALGYTLASCRTVPRTDILYIEGIVDVACEKTRIESHRKIIQSNFQKLEINVVNPVLQPFEKDTISFSVEGKGELTASGEGYNRYELKREVNDKTTVLTLTGVERLKVNLPSEALTKADLQPRGDKLEFSIDVDHKYIPKSAEADQLVVQYVVMSCKRNFMGLCAVFGSDERASETKYAVIKSSNTKLPVDVEYKRRYWIKYSIQRRNSIFYNDRLLPFQETQKTSAN